uniref:Putative ovule protein n=1 Tax=Solanum chacoense TaxID=4108 RepID=A0A0V0GWG2_SOLCH
MVRSSNDNSFKSNICDFPTNRASGKISIRFCNLILANVAHKCEPSFGNRSACTYFLSTRKTLNTSKRNLLGRISME